MASIVRGPYGETATTSVQWRWRASRNVGLDLDLARPGIKRGPYGGTATAGCASRSLQFLYLPLVSRAVALVATGCCAWICQLKIVGMLSRQGDRNEGEKVMVRNLRNSLVRLSLSLAAFTLMLGIAAAEMRAGAAAASAQEPTVTGQKPSPEGLATLHKIIDSGNLTNMRWPDFSPYRDVLGSFYQAGDYSLVWIRDGKPTPQALAIIPLLENADKKGLDPEDYDGPRWADRIAKLSAPTSDSALVSFDAALTICVARYARAIHTGRVNPKEFKFELDVESRRLPLAEYVRANLINSSDPVAELQKIEPAFPGYLRLLNALPVYTAMARADDGEQMQIPAKTIVAGQPYASTARLARFLRLTGDLPKDADVSGNSGIYDDTLAEAVKRYESRHGQAVDGKLTATSIKEMNVPLSFRVRQIQLTLERWRWLSHTFVSAPVVVNLPEFHLRTMDENGHVVLMKNVIVGKAYGHKSPVFEKEMRYVVFRPYWNVAPSIERNEIIPHIAKDRDYVSKERFEVVTASGELVTDGHVSDEVLAGLKAGKLHVRQKPGPKNSLGLVKLIFPNDDDVYLHGTDEPGLFVNTVRDFSHGCIRVENPADLAAWALRNNPGWNLERVKATMNGTEENIQVNLTTRIPVLIVYGTAMVNEDGEIHFYDDIYGYDAELEKALAKGYPYPQ
jgi:L,D-transpeptidase YcbB